MTRPARKQVPRKVIVAHWLARVEEGAEPPGPFLLEADDPEHACWACGLACAPDRAHIVDRFLYGLDGPQNLMLLCKGCHDRYPAIGPYDVDIAFAWTRAQMPYMDRFLHQVKSLINQLRHERLEEFFGG